MGFFDFLASPEQDAPEFVTKKKGALTKEQNAILNEGPATPPDGFMPPEKQDVEFEREQAASGGATQAQPPNLQADKLHKLSKDISKLAAEIMYGKEGSLAKQEGLQATYDDELRKRRASSPYPDSQKTRMIGPRVDRTTLESKFYANPENAAQVIENTLTDVANKDRLKSDPRVKLLNSMVVEYKQLSRSEGGQRYQASMQPTVGDADLADAAGHLESLSERKATLNRTLPDAASKAHAEEIRKQIKDIEAAEATGAERLTKLQSTRGFQSVETGVSGAGKKTFSEQNADPNMGPTNPKPIESEFKALGVKREKLVNDAMEILKGIGINEDEWDDQVPTQAGIKRLLSVVDPEGAFAQKLAADLVAEKKQNEPQEEDAAIGEEKVASASRSRALEIQMSAQRSEMKELYRSLNSQPFMQSWLGLTLYVVLGLLGGPTNAARLLGIGRNRNAIMGEIESIKEEMRHTSRQQEREEERAFSYRKEAIQRLKDEREYRRRKADSREEIYLRHKLILERARKTVSQENKPILDALQRDLNNVFKLMEGPEKAMNNDWVDNSDPKKIRATREYASLRDQAEFIADKIKALGTNKMVPGTYVEEGSEK